MKLASVIKELEGISPLQLAESWDNVGLLLAPTPEEEKEIQVVLLTIDLTEKVLEEAVSCGTNLILSYHPPIFQAFKSLQSNHWKQKIILSCIEKKIAIFSPHTALDAVEGGMNDWIISCFELSTSEPIQPTMGTNTNPAYSVLCSVCDEFKLETILCVPGCEVTIVSSVEASKNLKIEAPESSLTLLVSLLTAEGISSSIQRSQNSLSATCGMGRVGKLQKPLTIKDTIHLIKQHLHLDKVRVSFGNQHSLDSYISTIAVCAGSGSQVLSSAATAELYITGEMSHHDLLDAAHRGITAILCEHSNSERGFLKKLISMLQPKLPDLKLMLAKSDKDPVTIL